MLFAERYTFSRRKMLTDTAFVKTQLACYLSFISLLGTRFVDRWNAVDTMMYRIQSWLTLRKLCMSVSIKLSKSGNTEYSWDGQDCMHPNPYACEHGKKNFVYVLVSLITMTSCIKKNVVHEKGTTLNTKSYNEVLVIQN